MEGLGDRARDVVGIRHEIAVLRDRHGDAANIGLLEGIGADRRGRHLPGDGHHRHTVHVGVRDRRDQVRRTGTGGRHADPDASGRGGVALGRMPRALLMAHEDVADLLGVHQRVVQGQDRAPGNAEDIRDAGGLQGPHQTLSAGDVLAHRAPSRSPGALVRGIRTRPSNGKPPAQMGTEGARRPTCRR